MKKKNSVYELTFPSFMKHQERESQYNILYFTSIKVIN